MGLSTKLLLLSLAAAAVGAAIVWRQRTLRVRKTLLLIGLVIGTGIVFVSAVWLSDRAIESQGAAHAVYLLLVVTLPIIAGVAWFRAMLLRAADRESVGRGVLTTSLALAVGAASVGTYGTHIEPQWLRVDHHTLEADVTAPVRIVVIADMHMTSVDAYSSRTLNRAIAAEPDVLIFAGDLWDIPPDELPAHRAELREFLRRATDRVPAVVLVPGTTDGGSSLAPLAAESGAVFLSGTSQRFDLDAPVIVAGVDPFDRPGQREAIGGLVAAPPGVATILVSHAPDIVHSIPDVVGIDLVVSGATHGGQVAVPFVGPIFTNSTVANHVAAGGLHDYSGQRLYVSTGVGVERQESAQLRFGVRPSIGVFELIPESG